MSISAGPMPLDARELDCEVAQILQLQPVHHSWTRPGSHGGDTASDLVFLAVEKGPPESLRRIDCKASNACLRSTDEWPLQGSSWAAFPSHLDERIRQ